MQVYTNVYRYKTQKGQNNIVIRISKKRHKTKMRYKNENKIIVLYRILSMWRNSNITDTIPTRKQYYVLLRSDRKGETSLHNLHIICKYIMRCKSNRGNVNHSRRSITEFYVLTATQAWRVAKNANTHPDSVAAWLLLLPVALLTELLLAVLEFASSICAVFSNELHCLITSSPWASSSEIIVASSSSCNAGLEFNLKEKERQMMIIWFNEKNDDTLRLLLYSS